MSAAENYREAERLLAAADRHTNEDPDDMRIAAILATAAQAHATLALVEPRDPSELWAAYRAGFETSAVGSNGEYPEDPPGRDRLRVGLRNQFDEWFAAGGESGGAA